MMRGLREIYGLAYPHLESFYRDIGLDVIPEAALPPHLQRRALALAAHGYQTIGLLWRISPEPAPGPVPAPQASV